MTFLLRLSVAIFLIGNCTPFPSFISLHRDQSALFTKVSDNDEQSTFMASSTFRELYDTEKVRKSHADHRNKGNIDESLPMWLIDRCEELGFNTPTTVQQEALQEIFKGKDIILQAQTGSGKTLTYCLPVLAKVDPKRASIQTVVVVPTRELGLQVSGILKQLSSASPYKILVMSLMEGSQNRRQQLWAVAEPPHIVVGQPKQLQKIIDAGRLRLSAVNFVVLDEVDACLLNDNTRSELHKLLSQKLSSTFKDGDENKDETEFVENAVNSDKSQSFRRDIVQSGYRNSRQTIMCSATIPQRQHFAQQCYKNGWTETLPTVLHFSASELMPQQIIHEVVEFEKEDEKIPCIRYLLRKEREKWEDQSITEKNSDNKFQAIIFINKLEDTEEIYSSLTRKAPSDKIKAALLNEKMSLDERADSLDSFRSGTSNCLVCSEMLSRGIDVPAVTHVFQFELPNKADNYLHRSGRTGRLGREGKVISMITSAEDFVVKRFENELGIDIRKRVLKKSKEK